MTIATHQTTSRRLRFGGPVAFLVAAGVVFGAGTPACSAQSLSPDVATSTSITPEQADLIKKFAEANLGRLAGPDKADREKARDALLQPLTSPGLTVAFRLKYSDALAGPLEKLAANADDHVAVNALRVSGRLGTSAGLEALQAGLRDKRPAVRIGATRAIKDILRSLSTATGPTAIRTDSAERLIDQTAEALTRESDASAGLAMVSALDATRAGSPTGPGAALHTRAVEKLAGALRSQIERVRLLSDSSGTTQRSLWTGVFLTGVDAVRRTFIDPQRAATTSKKEVKNAAGRAAGQAIAFVRDCSAELGGAGLSKSADAAQLKVTLGAAEATLILIEGSMGQESLVPAFVKSAESGDLKDLNAAAEAWLSTNGRITKPPFSVNAKEFAPGPAVPQTTGKP